MKLQLPRWSSNRSAARSSKRPNRRLLNLEPLEGRTLLSLASVFEIDNPPNGANATTTSSHDWDQVYHDTGHSVSLPFSSAPSGTGALQFTTDLVNSGSDNTFSSSSKDTQDLNVWGWGSG